MYEVKETFNKEIFKDLLKVIKSYIIPFSISLVILSLVFFIVSFGTSAFLLLLVLCTITVKRVLKDLNPEEK